MSGPFNTGHAFVSDGRSPYCAECELLRWMHELEPKAEPRKTELANERGS